MTRSAFEVYKKVEGLRWQCTGCTNDFKGIWEKLNDLAAAVNEIKTLINLGGLVKAAVSEIFRVDDPTARSNFDKQIAVTNHQRKRTTGKKIKRRRKHLNTVGASSTPVDGSVGTRISQHNDGSTIE